MVIACQREIRSLSHQEQAGTRLINSRSCRAKALACWRGGKKSQGARYPRIFGRNNKVDLVAFLNLVNFHRNLPSCNSSLRPSPSSPRQTERRVLSPARDACQTLTYLFSGQPRYDLSAEIGAVTAPGIVFSRTNRIQIRVREDKSRHRQERICISHGTDDRSCSSSD